MAGLRFGHDEVRIRADVHIGEVTIVADDIYGVMINYTSRLLKAAAAGGIVVSDKAMQNVRNKLGDSFRDNMLARGAVRMPEVLGEFPATEQLAWRVGPKPPAPSPLSPRQLR